jgi:hypothetical protein
VLANFGPFLAIIFTSIFSYLMLTHWGVAQLQVIGEVPQGFQLFSPQAMTNSDFTVREREAHGRKAPIPYYLHTMHEQPDAFSVLAAREVSFGSHALCASSLLWLGWCAAGLELTWACGRSRASCPRQ